MRVRAVAALAYHCPLRSGMVTVLNPAPCNERAWSLPLEHLDVLVVNKIEASQMLQSAEVQPKADKEALFAQLARFCEARTGVKLAVMTDGPSGALLAVRESTAEKAWKYASAPALPSAKVVDTTGAGDCFIGYLLQSLACATGPFNRTDVAERALQRAIVASGLSVGAMGAMESIPSASAVESKLAEISPAALRWAAL